MLPGVTYYEPVFSRDRSDRSLAELPIASLEMSPHDRLLSVTSARGQLETLAQRPALTLHLPYHHETLWQTDAFDPSLLSISRPLIRWLEEVATLSEDSHHPLPLTLHGSEREANVDATYRMIDWFSNTIEKRGLPLRPSLENLYRGESLPFGRREQIEEALQRFSPLLGWTWDLTHDLRRRGQFDEPSKEMLARLTHVHLHGFNDGGDHLFLGSQRSLFTPYLDCLSRYGLSLPLILEVLVEGDYFPRIAKDLETLQFLHEKSG